MLRHFLRRMLEQSFSKTPRKLGETKKNTWAWSYIYHIYWQTTGLTIPGSITNLENLHMAVKAFFVVIADTKVI